MWHLIKKENLVIFKNWQSYFLTLIIPVLEVLVNLIMSQTSVTKLSVTVIDDSGNMQTLLPANINNEKGVSFSFNSSRDLEKAIKDVQVGKCSAIVEVQNQKYVKLYYDEARQDSQIAVKYITYSLQRLISDDLIKKYPSLVNELNSKQVYSISQAQNVGRASAESNNLNTMLLIGVIWIFVFTPLNQAMSQIQQEKTSSTLFYLYKIPRTKLEILFAKQIAVVIQCLLASVILFGITRIVGITNYTLHLYYLPISILLILCISSIGYFFGFLLTDTGSSIIVVLLLTLPTMLISSLNTSTALDPVMKIIPSYYVSQILKQMLTGSAINQIYIVITICITIIFYTLSCILFERRDPMRLCKNL